MAVSGPLEVVLLEVETVGITRQCRMGHCPHYSTIAGCSTRRIRKFAQGWVLPFAIVKQLRGMLLAYAAIPSHHFHTGEAEHDHHCPHNNFNTIAA